MSSVHEEADQVKPSIPEIIASEASIPLTADKYYVIDAAAKEELSAFIAACDAIPESEWRAWTEEEKMRYSSAANIADQIVRNSIIKP